MILRNPILLFTLLGMASCQEARELAQNGMLVESGEEAGLHLTQTYVVIGNKEFAIKADSKSANVTKVSSRDVASSLEHSDRVYWDELRNRFIFTKRLDGAVDRFGNKALRIDVEHINNDWRIARVEGGKTVDLNGYTRLDSATSARNKVLSKIEATGQYSTLTLKGMRTSGSLPVLLRSGEASYGVNHIVSRHAAFAANNSASQGSLFSNDFMPDSAAVSTRVEDALANSKEVYRSQDGRVIVVTEYAAGILSSEENLTRAQLVLEPRKNSAGASLYSVITFYPIKENLTPRGVRIDESPTSIDDFLGSDFNKQALAESKKIFHGSAAVSSASVATSSSSKIDQAGHTLPSVGTKVVRSRINPQIVPLTAGEGINHARPGDVKSGAIDGPAPKIKGI